MSADWLRVGLERLMAQWREQSAKDRDHGDSYRIGRGWGLEECADEVAALLHAHPPVDLYAQIRALPRNAHTITRNDGLTWKIEYVAWADLAALLAPITSPSAPVPAPQSVAPDPAPVATDTRPPDHT